MFRLINKKYMRLSALMAGGILLFITGIAGTSTAVFANADDSAESITEHAEQQRDSRLCPEGQFIELSYGFGGCVDVYDHEGNHCCQFYDYMDAVPVQLYPGKLRKINYQEGIFINMEDGSQIGPFPADSYTADVAGNYLIVQDLAAQTIEIYDESGKVVTSIPRTGDAVSWIIDKNLYILMQDHDSILAQYYEPSSDTWIGITGSCFSEANVWEFSAINRLGDWYVISGQSSIRVVDHNWEQVYKGTGYPFTDLQQLMDYQYNPVQISDISYFLEEFVENGEEYVRIMDSSLQAVLTVPRDEWYSGMECRGGFLTGVECEELGGRICAGIMEAGLGAVPYAREGTTCIFPSDILLKTVSVPEGEVKDSVPSDNRLITISIPEGEIPDSVNRSFLVTLDEDYECHLYDISTGSAVPLPEDLNYMYVDLGDSGYVVSGAKEPDFNMEYLLYDNEGNLIAHTEGWETLYPWFPGQWYYRNALSDGIIDESGHWLIRRWLQRD